MLLQNTSNSLKLKYFNLNTFTQMLYNIGNLFRLTTRLGYCNNFISTKVTKNI